MRRNEGRSVTANGVCGTVCNKAGNLYTVSSQLAMGN